MQFTETSLRDAFIIDVDRHTDERGFFARSWCEQELAAAGLNPRVVQCNISWNAAKGTIRGMHYQIAPHAEVKIVRVTKGAIYDVIADLRPASPTFRQHVGVELTSDNRRALYVPEGFAHGFLTLADDSEVFYQMSAVYEPSAARGVRWNDPAFGIVWPGAVRVIAPRDRDYPDFKADCQ